MNNPLSGTDPSGYVFRQFGSVCLLYTFDSSGAIFSTSSAKSTLNNGKKKAQTTTTSSNKKISGQASSATMSDEELLASVGQTLNETNALIANMNKVMGKGDSANNDFSWLEFGAGLVPFGDAGYKLSQGDYGGAFWSGFEEGVFAVAGAFSGGAAYLGYKGYKRKKAYDRIMSNIESSRAARSSSFFKIHVARTDQAKWGYSPDEWGLSNLKIGDTVLGGVPGQSAYYTTMKTLSASGGNTEQLFKSLQVSPHPEFGYRTQMAKYKVMKDIKVPTSMVRANPNLGKGGGDQYFISNYEKVLQQTSTIKLGQ